MTHQIKILEGVDQINAALTSAMTTTIRQLICEKKLDEKVAENFLDTHACIIVSHDGGLRAWFKRRFGNEEGSKVICVVLP